MSSVNDHDDLPLDIPDLPDIPHFPHITEKELSKDKNLKDSLECTDLSSNNSSILQSDHNYYNKHQSPNLEELVDRNSKTDNDCNEMPQIENVETPAEPDVCSNEQVNDVSKLHITLQSADNSSSSQSNDNVCRSESPPSLVFSAESLNCDDNQSDDFEEFHQNADDVECNLPSLKLDSISDTKSLSSDLEETNNSVECEIDESRDNCEITNAASSNSNVEAEFVESDGIQDRNVECNVTVTSTDDIFDDFVEYASNVAVPEKCDIVEHEAVDSEKSHQSDTQSKELKDENLFAADFSQFELYSDNKTDEPAKSIGNYQHEAGDSTSDHLNTEHRTLTNVVDEINDFGNVDDDDDEFGDFNDFSDFSQSTFVSSLTTNIEELSAKIKPLLDTLFPNSDNDLEDSNYDALDLTNDTTRIIKDFENSKALDHQWTSSVGKSSLVTALGIDSRNIVNLLYCSSDYNNYNCPLFRSYMEGNGTVQCRDLQRIWASVRWNQ